jgi:hypothetical protein
MADRKRGRSEVGERRRKRRAERRRRLRTPAPLRALLLAVGLGSTGMLAAIGLTGSIEPVQDATREHVVCPLLGDARGCDANETVVTDGPTGVGDEDPCEELRTVRSELERVFAAIHEEQAGRLGAVALPDDPHVIELSVQSDREKFVGILAAYVENDCE